MTGGALRRLSALLIVSAAFGCDNVDWGGADLRLQSPPPARVGAPPDTATAEPQRVDEPVPEGPVLYMAERDSQSIRMVPVGAILGDGRVILILDATGLVALSPVLEQTA